MILLRDLINEIKTGKKFNDELADTSFTAINEFPVEIEFEVENKKVEVQIPVKINLDNLRDEIQNYLQAPPELKEKLKTYAYWYDNFNKLVFGNMGESDACLFMAACGYCSANTALDQNILEAAKLYTVVKQDFQTDQGKKALSELSRAIKSNLKNKDLDILARYPNSAYANLLLPKKDYKGIKIQKGPKQGQDDIFSEITVSNAKIPNFNKYVEYYLKHNGQVNKEQLYEDIESGLFKISGTKINSFLINLIFPDKLWKGKFGPATIDRWMIRFFFEKPLKEMVENDIADWIEFLPDESDEVVGDKMQEAKRNNKPKLTPEEHLAAKHKKELEADQDAIINRAIMKLFGNDDVRQSAVHYLNKDMEMENLFKDDGVLKKLFDDEFKKTSEKFKMKPHQIQALAWVNIRERYNEPAAKFSKFEDVMEYAYDAAEKIMNLDPSKFNVVLDTIKMLASGPRFKFNNPAQVVDTIQNREAYEKVYYIPPKIKKLVKNKSNVNYAKMKVALVDDTKADIYDLSVSKKKPIHTVQGTDRKSTLSQSLKWILSYNPTPQATPTA